MAVTVQGFNIGTDASVTISDSFGDVFTANDLGYLMDFDSEADDSEIKITPITGGGVPVFQTVWNGGRGRLMYTRMNGNFQQMILDLMAAYYSSGIIPQFALSLSVLNRDSSVDEYLYTGMQFTKPKFGNFRALKEVDQAVDFVWSQCVATGGLTAFLTNLAAAA
jgi:hypothetical protein